MKVLWKRVGRMVLCCLLLISVCSAKNLVAQKLTAKQQAFIQMVLSNTRTVNTRIEKNRLLLLKLYQQRRSGNTLKPSQVNWLNQLAKEYALSQPNFQQDKTWLSLEKRVDIIPPSLVIAQAVHESSWGRSRFAKLGNNFFGQHCYVAGCGIIPKRRAKGATFEVQKFATPRASVSSYIHLLNTKRAYRTVRVLRYDLEVLNRPIDGMILANGLQHYSEQRSYIYHIKHLILEYFLFQYDDLDRRT